MFEPAAGCKERHRSLRRIGGGSWRIRCLVQAAPGDPQPQSLQDSSTFWHQPSAYPHPAWLRQPQQHRRIVPARRWSRSSVYLRRWSSPTTPMRVMSSVSQVPFPNSRSSIFASPPSAALLRRRPGFLHRADVCRGGSQVAGIAVARGTSRSGTDLLPPRRRRCSRPPRDRPLDEGDGDRLDVLRCHRHRTAISSLRTSLKRPSVQTRIRSPPTAGWVVLSSSTSGATPSARVRHRGADAQRLCVRSSPRAVRPRGHAVVVGQLGQQPSRNK